MVVVTWRHPGGAGLRLHGGNHPLTAGPQNSGLARGTDQLAGGAAKPHSVGRLGGHSGSQFHVGHTGHGGQRPGNSGIGARQLACVS